jgi:ABC-type transporter Mla subunit MlaD
MNTPLWNWVVRRRIALANLSLIVVLVIGSGYLARYVLRFNPIPHTFTVTVQLATSGGILPGNDVTFRGTRVGKVSDVRVSGDGIDAIAEIDDSARIPVGGARRASSTWTFGPTPIPVRIYPTAPSWSAHAPACRSRCRIC